jgi:hypothetical protein
MNILGLTHRHHKQPKSLGGTDDEDNMADLLVIDHAIAHLVRYRMFGHWQDYLAYMGLTGQIEGQDLIRETQRLANLGRDNSGANNPMWNKKHSEETKRRIGAKSVNRNWGRHTPVTGANNPTAKRARITHKGIEKIYDHLRAFCDECSIPYATLKSIAQDGRYSKKWDIHAEYV